MFYLVIRSLNFFFAWFLKNIDRFAGKIISGCGQCGKVNDKFDVTIEDVHVSADILGQTLTFYDEVEEFWSRAAFTLDGACIEAIVGDVHLRYLKAVLMFVPDARHNGHTRVHRPLVVPCKYDAGAIQPGSFRDPIQQVAPTVTEKGNTSCMNPNRQRNHLKFVFFEI